MAGDEWLRAIFRYAGNDSAVAGEEEYRTQPNIMDHLKAVERDYLSLKNKILVSGKSALTIIRKLLPF